MSDSLDFEKTPSDNMTQKIVDFYYVRDNRPEEAFRLVTEMGKTVLKMSYNEDRIDRVISERTFVLLHIFGINIENLIVFDDEAFNVRSNLLDITKQLETAKPEVKDLLLSYFSFFLADFLDFLQEKGEENLAEDITKSKGRISQKTFADIEAVIKQQIQEHPEDDRNEYLYVGLAQTYMLMIARQAINEI